jgi:hypothetical protein
MGTLYLEVNAGLCNRLRALVSGICWAEEVHRKLVVCWPDLKPECAASFSNLFDGTGLPDWIEINNRTLVTKIQVLSPADAADIFMSSDPILFIQSHGCFWPRDTDVRRKKWLSYLRLLKPSPEVTTVLESWSSSITPDSVAVHIRRTDNGKAIRLSPLEAFRVRLHALQKHMFLLVFSDDERAIDAMKSEFGYRVLAPETIRNRGNLDGMIEATAVFFALASKPLILGSANSSFSEIACDYGNSVLELVTT